MRSSEPIATAATAPASLLSLFLNYFIIGLKGWGGPIAQIGLIHEDAVDKKGWIDNETFRDAYAVCSMLPGPEAAELCMYIGYMKRKWLGGLVAGLGFMLPGFVLITLLAWLYFRYADTAAWIPVVLYGVKPAMIAIVGFSLYKLAGKFGVLSSRSMALMALLIVVAGGITSVDLTILLLLTGLLYMLLQYRKLRRKTDRTLSIAPISLIAATAGQLDPGSQIAWLFFKVGALSFGGAYTVLALLQFEAVDRFGWLTTAQYIDGLAINELVPGPLIMIAAFIGFAANGWPGAAVATFFIFLPAFLVVLVGAPYFHYIRSNRAVKLFLEGICAAVVGLTVLFLLSLSLEVFRDWLSPLLAVVSLILLIRFKWPLWSVFLVGVALGACVQLWIPFF